jgi:hypothetical protein
MINGAQQSGRNWISPTAPGFGDARVLDVDVLMGVYCCVAVFTGWKILLWDERSDVVLDAFCVRLFGLVCD